MKKRILALLCIASLTLPISVSANDETIHVKVNGQEVTFSRLQPVIKNGTTLVPIRDVLEAMGVSVTWDADRRKINMKKGGTSASLIIGEKSLTCNNKQTPLDTPAQIINDSTMLPIRAVAEAFGATVGWEDQTNTITIKTAPASFTTTTSGLAKEDQSSNFPKYTEISESKDHISQLGTTLIHMDFRYPQLTSSVESTYTTTINNSIYHEITEFTDTYIKNNQDDLYAASKKALNSFPADQIKFDYEDVYFDSEHGLFSFLMTCTVKTGSGDTSLRAYGKTYDLATGKEIYVGSLYHTTDDNQTLAEYVFLNDILKTPVKYLDSASQLLNSGSLQEGQCGIYLSEDKKAIAYAVPGLISPKENGILKVKTSLNFLKQKGFD